MQDYLDKSISFKEDTHEYFFGKEKYGGTTSLIKDYHPKKDWGEIADKYVEKNSRKKILTRLAEKYEIDYKKALTLWGDADITGDWIRERWAEISQISLKVGSAYHDWRERKLYPLETCKVPYTERGLKYAYDLRKLTDGVYPELIVWSHKYKRMGQIDKATFESGKVTLVDYKTSATIDIEPTPFYNPKLKRKVVERFVTPLSHLATTNYNDYCLQMSIYGLMLEAYGWEVESLWIEHIKLDSKQLEEKDFENVETDLIKVPYLREEAKALLEYDLALQKYKNV